MIQARAEDTESLGLLIGVSALAAGGGGDGGDGGGNNSNLIIPLNPLGSY